MRCVFENLLDKAVITSTGFSDNYPAINVIHPFLHKRAQLAGTTGATLTATWDTDQTMDSIAAFYTHAANASFSVAYYNSAGTLISTVTFSIAQRVAYTTKFTTVRKVIISFPANASILYYGSIWLGVYSKLPFPIADWQYGLLDRSNISESASGQVSIEKARPRKTLKLNYYVEGLPAYTALLDAFKTQGQRLLVLDLAETAHIASVTNPRSFEPLYGYFENFFEGGAKRENIFYFSLTFREAF